jgi:hypothetical protein
VRNDNRKAHKKSKDAQRDALLALPGVRLAHNHNGNGWARGVKHAMQSMHRGQNWGLYVLSCNRPKLACQHPKCVQLAQPTPDKGTTHCVQHGGGPRCEASGAHVLDPPPPHASYKFSSAVACNGTPRPEWVGKPACLSCLKQLDPSNVAVKVLARKEDLTVAAIDQGLYDAGYPEIAAVTSSILTHDCAEGPSRRRKDLAVAFCRRLLGDFEQDEGQHKDRALSCERRKLAGHMIDAGASGLTHDESKLWDETLPDDIALEEMLETPADTAAMRALRRKRAAVITRLVREVNARKFASSHGDADAIVPKLHTIRFNCDDYIANDGYKAGSLFKVTEVTNKDVPFVVDTTDAFAPAIKAVVKRIIELWHLCKDEAWIDAHRELEVEYWRYDGCGRDGRDPDMAVARAHAARRVDKHGDEVDAEGTAVPMDPKAAARLAAIKRAANKRKREQTQSTSPSEASCSTDPTG